MSSSGTWLSVALMCASVGMVLATQKILRGVSKTHFYGALTLFQKAHVSQRAAKVLDVPDVRALHVIMDYDRTITSDTASECHSILLNEEVMGASFCEKMARMLDFSTPNPILEGKEFAYWWEYVHAMLVEHRMTHAQLRGLIEGCDPPMALREGAVELLRLLHKLRVPVTVVSAGLTPVIEERLRKSGCLLDNMTISANDLIFEDGVCVRYSTPTVNSNNKNETYQRLAKWFAEDDRARGDAERTLLVLGDSPGDVRCAEGVPNCAKLCVGFYDPANPWNPLEKFQASYDVLLPKDASFGWLLEALRGKVTTRR